MTSFMIDFIAINIQSYLSACIFCNIFPVKKPRWKSLLIADIQMIVCYFVVNYIFCETSLERIISGTITFVIFGFFLYEGSRVRQIGTSILQYMLMLTLDLAISVLLFVDFVSLIRTLLPEEHMRMGRNLATALLFFILAIIEFVKYLKEKKKISYIMVLGILMSIVQLIILDTLANANTDGMITNRFMITIFLSFAVMGGYLILMSLFKTVQAQQKKKHDLEQVQLETKYQYESYRSALQHGEQLRNLRHDMKNQLQAVQFLLNSKRKEDRSRADVILEEMKNRVEV